ncbi:MAG: hypothetical protein ABIM88_02910 [candidate division WOR-3 bacterium]
MPAETAMQSSPSEKRSAPSWASIRKSTSRVLILMGLGASKGYLPGSPHMV